MVANMQKATGNHCIIFPSIIVMALFRSKLNSGVSPPLGSPGGTVLNNLVKRNTAMKVATWNVRSLYEMVKMEWTIKEMERMKIDILGISEMRWKGSGIYDMPNHKIYYAGNDEPQHWRGVGFILKKQKAAAVRNFVPQSDRVALLQLQGQGVQINLIQVYAPTADRDDTEMENFYGEIREVLKLTKREDVNIIMGDFNSKVGAGHRSDVNGEWGLGERNDRGDQLVQFCQEEECIIMNTVFQLPPRRLYTWRSPRDQPGHVVRNQIDFFLINKRFRNAVKYVKTMPGADIGTDHSLMICELNVKLKKVLKKSKKKVVDPRKLSEENIKRRVVDELEDGVREVAEMTEVEELWSKIRGIINNTSDRHLNAERNQHKEWMTAEILSLMEERKKWQNSNRERYRELHRNIQRLIREAKRRVEEEKCRELEDLQDRHDTFNLHKKIKESISKKRGRQIALLTDDDGNLVTNVEEKKNLWKSYVENLYNDDRGVSHGVEGADEGPRILEDEVTCAIKQLNNGKAPGPDNTHGEVLKLLGDNGIKLVTKLFNRVYETGEIPRDWLKSYFITLAKKPNAKKCEEHRTISLMSHVLKVFLKVVLKRIYRQCDEQISDEQFGFRNGFGTRDALFGLQVLVQRCLDINQDVYMCFIDYEKAFDRVRHEKLIEILQEVGIDDRNVRVIANLYWQQVASVLMNDDETSDIAIKRGVRQGCVLSPTLFNLYSERVMNRALNEASEGIRVNGQLINSLRYADDMVVLASSPEELQSLLNRVNEASRHYGININVKKTKSMIVSKSERNPVNLTLNGEFIEKCQKFKYLGCYVNERWEMTEEIVCRIEQARKVFVKMKKLLTSRNLSLDLRIRMVKCYVFPIVLYGMEGWTMTQKLEERITAFEMWVYRRMLRISWRDHVTNVEVLRRMNKSTELLLTVRKRKLLYFGHIMRNSKYQLLHLIIQGKIEGKRAPGRRRTSWLKNLRQWFGKSTRSLFRAVASKIQIALMIANLQT